MSSALAGKFQDHYEVLGVDPKADMETIQSAYTKLAEQFHPSNPKTGDQEQFDAVNSAYEVLSDSDLRSTFNKLKGIGQNDIPIFSGRSFFDTLGRDSGLRGALVSVLYERRRQKPFTPGLSVRHVENMLVATPEELFFALWYLKQRGLIMSDDKSNLQITIQGIDYLETNSPSPDLVMPFFKPTALAAPDQAAAAKEAPKPVHPVDAAAPVPTTQAQPPDGRPTPVIHSRPAQLSGPAKAELRFKLPARLLGAKPPVTDPKPA